MPDRVPQPDSVVDRALGGGPSARFDDLTVAGRSFRLEGFRSHITAWAAEDVAGAITAAESAARLGSWVAGFVSYEAAAGLDPVLAVRVPPGGEPHPLVWFGVFDRRRPVDRPCPPPPAPIAGLPSGGTGWTVDIDAASFAALIDRIRSRIGDGETYQLNLTHPWRSVDAGDPCALYRRLLLAQQPAYGALIDTGRWVVASASPELFFHWRHGVVTCRPMKGTAARGRWSEEDQEMGAALASSAKDRAENVMIVDLVRNDLGRVADYGSVAVSDLCHLERYPTVWQLTSQVTARTRPGTTLVELFRALFPCGSVTGAPKHLTMHLITEMEAVGRGVYCGAVGLVGPEESRFNVAIRTTVIDRYTGRAVYGAGGGIVWDSDPEREFAEAKAKAAILAAEVSEFDLVETMAFRPRPPDAGLRNRDRHLHRLAGSAEYFGYRFCRPAIDDALDQRLLTLTAPTRVRLSLSRWGRVSIDVTPLPDAGRDAGRRLRAVRLAVDDDPVDPADAWLFHKTSRRRAYTDRLARHRGVDDIVLMNHRGEATETTIANLAVCLDGRWWTPPLDAGCLPGVERGRLLEAGILGERTITVPELATAAGIAVVSSVRGWRRARVVPRPPQEAAVF